MRAQIEEENRLRARNQSLVVHIKTRQLLKHVFLKFERKAKEKQGQILMLKATKAFKRAMAKHLGRKGPNMSKRV